MNGRKALSIGSKRQGSRGFDSEIIVLAAGHLVRDTNAHVEAPTDAAASALSELSI